VLLATVALAVTPSMYRKLPYDPLKDLVPVTQITSHALVLSANPKLSVSSLQNLIATAKAKPGAINFGSTGAGTSTQLLLEQLKLVAGIDMVHVPYKGDAPMVAALLSGELQLGLVPAISAISHIQAGRLRPLGVTGSKRTPLLPDVPTIGEAGATGFDSPSWIGVFAPAAVPKDILSRFQGGVAKVIALPDVKSRLASQGFEAIGNTPEEFSARFLHDHATYAKVVREARVPLLE
jgi:tripartite-type tricarboxylate transporter receptor subunit TctC